MVINKCDIKMLWKNVYTIELKILSLKFSNFLSKKKKRKEKAKPNFFLTCALGTSNTLYLGPTCYSLFTPD